MNTTLAGATSTNMKDKDKDSERTFESRLLFISSIFEEKFPPFVIMAKCIEHKLD